LAPTPVQWAPPEAPLPPQFVALGRVLGPVGLRGELRIRSLHPGSAFESALLQQQHLLCIRLRAGRRTCSRFEVLQITAHGRDFRLSLLGVDDPLKAQWFDATELGVDRSALPPPSADEVYWVDLIGCRVENREGLMLGLIERMETNGVHDWLVVGPHWIPFVERHVDSVDIPARLCRVDWDPDWLKGT